MARIGNVDPNIYLKDFKGINNLSDEKEIDNNTLKDAVNIDVNRQGNLKSREGYKKIHSGTDCHSLFSDKINMYFVDEDELHKCNKNYEIEIIDSGYKNLKTQYIKRNNSLVISNHQFIRRFSKNKIYDVAPPTFDNTFEVNKFPNGGFSKGRYQVAVTFLFDDGIEGGTKKSKIVELEENQGIEITNLQINIDPNITKFRVYVSETNGTTLFRYGDFDINLDSIEIRNTLELGDILETQHLYPIVNGDFIEEYKGVIYTAKGNILYYSKPLSFLTEANNFEDLGSEITLLVAVEDGLFISTEEGVFFFSGDNMNDFNKNLVYNSPAIKYMFSKNINTNEVFFFTRMGQMVAGNGGKLENITDSMFIPHKNINEGATLIKYKNGLKQIINAYKNAGKNKNGVRDFATCKKV